MGGPLVKMLLSLAGQLAFVLAVWAGILVMVVEVSS